MAKHEIGRIEAVSCSRGEIEAVLEVTNGTSWPLAYPTETWLKDFRDYGRKDGALWVAASGVTEAIRGLNNKPDFIFFT